jgi:hypothetical protein
LSTIAATSTLSAGAAGADAGAAVGPALGAAPPLAGAAPPAGVAAVALEPKIAPMIFPKMLIICSQCARDGVKLKRHFCAAGSTEPEWSASLATALCLANEAFTEA